MNILLKYFIFFLLGIIIYYFLFNSPDIGAKKLIEGFDVGRMGTEIPLLFIKNGTITASEGGISGTETGETFAIKSELGEGDVPLSFVEVTVNEDESIFKSEYLRSLVDFTLNSTNYANILDVNGDNNSLLKNISFKSARLPQPIIPDSINFDLVLPPRPDGEEDISLNRPISVSKVESPNFSNLQSIFSDNDINDVNSIVYMENGGTNFASSNLGSDASTAITNMVYSGPIIIFKFTADSMKLFGPATMHLLLPDDLDSNRSGMKLIGTKTDSSDNDYGTYISNANETLGTGNSKFGNYYRIRKGMSNIGEIVDANFRIGNQINRFTTNETVEDRASADANIQYNLEINFPELISTISNNNIVSVNTETNELLSQEVLNELRAEIRGYTVRNGVVTGEITDTTDTDLKITQRTNYHYRTTGDVNIFQYVNLYRAAASKLITVDTTSEDAVQAKKLNSIFLDMRIFNVKSDGTFGTQRGCAGTGDVDSICNKIASNHGRPARYFTPKEHPHTTCDPHEVGSIASGMAGNAGSCFSDPTLCCQNNSCANWLATRHEEGRTGSEECARLGKAPIYAGIPAPGAEPDQNTCCGIELHGYISKLFNSIKSFGDTLYGRTDSQTPSSRYISRDYIKYYIYDNMLNMEAMIEKYNSANSDHPLSAGTNTTPLTPTTGDYDKIINFITDNIIISYKKGNSEVGSIKIKGALDHPNAQENIVFPPELSDINEGETGGTLSNILQHIVLKSDLLSSEETYGNLKARLESTNLNDALSPDLGPVLDLSTVEQNYGFFLQNFGGGYTSNGQTTRAAQYEPGSTQLNAVTLEDNMKLSLVMLVKQGLPTELGLSPAATPLEKAFPELEYNLATFSIYL